MYSQNKGQFMNSLGGQFKIVNKFLNGRTFGNGTGFCMAMGRS